MNKRNPDFGELLEQLLVVEKNYIEKSLTQNGTISKTESGNELTDPLLSYWIETNVMKNI